MRLQFAAPLRPRRFRSYLFKAIQCHFQSFLILSPALLLRIRSIQCHLVPLLFPRISPLPNALPVLIDALLFLINSLLFHIHSELCFALSVRVIPLSAFPRRIYSMLFQIKSLPRFAIPHRNQSTPLPFNSMPIPLVSCHFRAIPYPITTPPISAFPIPGCNCSVAPCWNDDRVLLGRIPTGKTTGGNL